MVAQVSVMVMFNRVGWCYESYDYCKLIAACSDSYLNIHFCNIAEIWEVHFPKKKGVQDQILGNKALATSIAHKEN
jgi:hypothetical protein